MYLLDVVHINSVFDLIIVTFREVVCSCLNTSETIMFNQVTELAKATKSYFQNHHERRLFFDTCLITSCLLFTLCAVVTSQQYFGNPIECMQDNKNDQPIPESVLNKFCFISVSYIAVDFKGPPESSRKHSFYPWVPLVLLLQGLSFLLPQNVWSYIDDGFFEKFLKDRNSLIIGNEKVQLLARYLAMRMSSFMLWSLGYVLAEVLFVLNVIVNFYFTDIFLGGGFVKYGLQVFFNVESAQATSFPSMTRCTFRKFGPSGTIESRDALCVMTLNMLNEKIYLLLWFWFSFLLVISALIIVCRLWFLTIVSMRKKSSCLIRLTLTPQLGWNSTFVLANKLSVCDWIFLQQLGKSMNPTTYSELLENVVLELREPCNMEFLDVVPVYKKCEIVPDSNSNV
ncbi:innexin inx3-like [Halyomorpha halys]|uniref:innexin inx3-like n=1 Tax=Halyomorpha halys TaxID=286706 RepID=UPI0006D4FC5B